MALSLTPLFSGSSGNAILVSSDRSKVLIDAGVSGRRLEEALQKPSTISKEFSSPTSIVTIFRARAFYRESTVFLCLLPLPLGRLAATSWAQCIVVLRVSSAKTRFISTI
jgi:hypothetical protein